MINTRIIFSVIGQLLLLEALLLAVCLGVSLYMADGIQLSWLVTIGVAAALGLFLLQNGRHAPNRVGRRDGYLVVSLTWIVFSVVGTLPFLISGREPRLAAAFFETMSGFTTTGATILPDVDAVEPSLLMWRSLMHWVGGVGIVFFTLAFLPESGSGSQKIFSAEATGLKVGKLHPRISTTVHWILSLYVLLTAVCAAVLYIEGMSPFDAVNHAMTALSTGGFSTHTASIAWFNSPRIELTLVVFMLLASIRFSLLYMLIIRGRLREVISDAEVRFFLGMVLAVALLWTTADAVVSGAFSLDALRLHLFHAASIASTTGLTSGNFMDLTHPVGWMPLALLTIMGGCAGSTSGGVKAIRLLTLWRTAQGEFRRLLHPRAVMPLRVGPTIISERIEHALFAYFTVMALVIFVSSAVMITLGLPMLDSLSLSLTSFANVGPGLGWAVTPVDAWNALPDGVLYMLSFVMLCGRLEIFSLLLPFVPAFWENN